jgi:hypothetical protein|tara:strand:+ start:15014 stop:15631 length:618 start_codon:yes stop_codon:yes gene_type:complete
MNFNGTFKALGHVDITQLKSVINAITEEQWHENNERQKFYKVHNFTQTIPLLFDADYRHHYPTPHSILELFQTSLAPVLKAITEYYENQVVVTKSNKKHPIGKAYFIRALLVRMSANSEIAEHSDNGYSLSRVHRIHLPIVTNKKVEFFVDGHRKSFNEGELWEINNRKKHSVSNKSDEDRIHLIFDFVIPGEVIEDPIDKTIYA